MPLPSPIPIQGVRDCGRTFSFTPHSQAQVWEFLFAGVSLAGLLRASLLLADGQRSVRFAVYCGY
ncbi:MAG: hypothetical protein MUF49_07675 [Oculatellaceae cyanobacterium Prado106]|jgi:hypothetical protein|nr:hypothetical protein [Oculatellaceae cyanobacterium Prado106]